MGRKGTAIRDRGTAVVGRHAGRLAAVAAALAVGATGAAGSPAPAGASVRPVVPAAGVHEAALAAVSCPRAKLCIAVGRRARPHGQAPFAERWRGGSWTDQAIPAPKAIDAFLVAISCASSTDCTAVGGEASSRTRSGPLAEQWNGHRWRVTQASDPAGVTAGNLYGVSCASATNCVAVGTAQGRNRDVTLSERWNGRSWKLLPQLKVRRPAGFTGVNCTARFCMAVGEIEIPAQTGEVAMAAKLTRNTWQLVSTPGLAGSNLAVFYADWCSSRVFCLAVGQYQGATDTAIAEQWTGATWVPQSISAANQILFGISCASSVRCMAVGSGTARPVSQQWTGVSWTSVPTAHIAGGSFASLYQVSCPTATRCLAVGARSNGGLGVVGSPLAEEWNGSSWRVVATASP
jgi:hypothetical protein